MSNDFEVMPIGTMEEVREMRKFANELIGLAYEVGPDANPILLSKIYEIERFYKFHSEKYPVTV